MGIISRRRLGWIVALAIVAVLGWSGMARMEAQVLKTPPAQRWLEVRQVVGTVTFRGDKTHPAVTGNRLEKVNQGLTTGALSSAILAIDDGIGFIQVSENTDLQVQSLSVTEGGGKITEIKVNRGQARLNVRRFTDPESRLRIQTPAGVAAVRGTQFGVTVSAKQKSGITTQSGVVSVSAQQRTVDLGANQFSTIVPGQPPAPPQFLSRNVSLEVQSIVPLGVNQLVFTGVTEAPNLVFINDQEVVVKQNGAIVATIPKPLNKQLNILIRSPLGLEQRYLYQVP